MHAFARPVSSSRLLRWVAVALAAALLCVVPAPPASAHDELLSSDPAESSVVETLPSRATLVLSGEVRKVREVSVTGPDGDVANGEATFRGNEVRQNLWAGPEGEYVLSYDVVSADGHQVTGEVHFEVGPVSGPTDSGSRVTVEQDAGGWGGERSILVLGAGLLAGAGGLVLLRRRRLG